MFEQMKFKIKNWQRYRQALAELNVHSDRELSEMGLMRCDLPRIARETAVR